MNFEDFIATHVDLRFPPFNFDLPGVDIRQEFRGIVPVFNIGCVPGGGVFCDLGNLFSSVANLLFMIAFVFAFAYLIWGGFRLITAGGEERAVSEARETITYAIIGIVIVFLSYLIVKLVEGVTGVVIF